MDRRRFLLASLAGAAPVHTAPRITTGWLICVLALAAGDPLWTLWEIAPDGKVVKMTAGLEYQTCETMAGVFRWRVDIQWDIIVWVPAKAQYRCRPDGEGLE